MVEFFWGLLTGCWATYYIINRFFDIRRKYPYRWACDEDDCLFQVATSSDDPDILMRIIEGHKASHNV